MLIKAKQKGESNESFPPRYAPNRRTPIRSTILTKAKSLNFGKSVGDKGWGMFVTMLTYKAETAGKKVIKADKFFPSSKMCYECESLNKKTKDLSVREWTCPHSGHHHDRDENAALNIRDEAVRIYCTC